jgi:hypothetical protein
LLPLCPSTEIAEKFDTAKPWAMRHASHYNRGGTTNSIDKAAIQSFVLISFSGPYQFNKGWFRV